MSDLLYYCKGTVANVARAEWYSDNINANAFMISPSMGFALDKEKFSDDINMYTQWKSSNGTVLYQFGCDLEVINRLTTDKQIMLNQLNYYNAVETYGDFTDELAEILAKSINDVHEWTWAYPKGNIVIRDGEDYTLSGKYNMLQTNNSGDDFTSRTWANSLEWVCFTNAPASPEVQFRLALFAIIDDIEKNLIECSDGLKNKLYDTLKSGLITSRAVEWRVNIDGVKNPLITLTWESPLAENTDNCSVQIDVGNSKDPREKRFYLGRFDYENGQPQSWSFNELYESGSDATELNTKINEFLMNLISNIKSYTYLFMKMTYVGDGHISESSLCYAEIHWDGKCYGGVLDKITDGSKVIITYENTDDIYENFEDKYDSIDINNYGVSALSLLTKSYVMSTTRLKQLGNFLWSDDFMTKILNVNSNPIENIISCKVFPFTINGNSEKEIILGNVSTGILGNPIEENTNFIIDVGTFKIPKYYNNWLDYERTTIGVFLPMCGGFHNLDVNSYMGKTLNIKYYIDILTGICKAVLYVNNIPCEEFAGQIGFDIPLTASNRSQVELAQITSLANASMSLASGNIGGISNIGNAIFPPKTSYSTVGSISPTVNMMTTHDVFLIIERPKIQYPSLYNHTFGKPCNLSMAINNLHGFTICENVDLTGISCTEEERYMIKNILESGFYVD